MTETILLETLSIFTKAFDTVDHEISLHELHRYGILGHANNFFRSYLTNRTQYTPVNGVRSDVRSITCGVPQGSVLGPLILVLYINDLNKAIENAITRILADDTALILYEKGMNILEDAVSRRVQKLCRWCIDNKLSIRIGKTNLVLFHTPNEPLVKHLRKIETEAMNNKRVDVFTYLGVYIDDKLALNAHVENVCNSLLKLFSIFKQRRHTVAKNTVRQLYHAFINSKIKSRGIWEVYEKIYPKSKLYKIDYWNYWNISCIVISEHGLTCCTQN